MMHPFQLVVGYIPIDTRIFEHTQIIRTSQCVGAQFERGLWRNGSASDSRSEGWAFEPLWPHDYGLSVVAALRLQLLLSWAHVLQVEITKARSK